MDRTRAAVKEVIPCDANAEEILFDPSKGPFDFILITFCLESACADLKSYNESFCKLSNLLNPGGKFFFVGNLMETIYKVKDKIFDHLAVTKDNVTNAIESSGMVIESYEWANTTEVEQFTGDGEGTFCIVAVKK